MTYDLRIAEEVFGKQFKDVEEIKDYIEEKTLEDEKVKQFLDIHEKIWRKEEVAEDGRKMYSEVWKDVTDFYIDRVKECLEGIEDNRFSCGYVADVLFDEVGQIVPDENRHKIIFIHGGKNGDGKWNEYLVDALSLFNKLKSKEYGGFNDVYLIKWDVDVADDVFYMWIGVK